MHTLWTTEWLRARLYWRPLFESPRLDISVILNFQKNSITEMQRRQLFDKVRFLDCLLSNMVQYWFNSSFFYIFYLSRISTRDCEDLADDSSEATKVATQRPFRDSAKMSCMREGHMQLKVWRINTFSLGEGRETLLLGENPCHDVEHALNMKPK